jgi:hypothetical protein
LSLSRRQELHAILFWDHKTICFCPTLLFLCSGRKELFKILQREGYLIDIGHLQSPIFLPLSLILPASPSLLLSLISFAKSMIWGKTRHILNEWSLICPVGYTQMLMDTGFGAVWYSDFWGERETHV